MSFCDDFHERALSANELSLLPGSLAGALDLRRVRIVRRWHSPVAALLQVTIVRGWRIFWAHAPAEATTTAARAHLAHELVHVWQYKGLRRTGPELLASRFYRYRLDPARTFLSYGYEQQASIVEDYVRVRDGARPHRARTPEADAAAYAAVIGSAAANH